MPIRHLRWAAPAALFVLAACTDSGDPWARLPDPPLTQGRLHTVTIAGDAARARTQALDAGYSALAFAPNYPGALRVEASLWGVPEPVAGRAAMFKSPGNGPNLRIIDMTLAAGGREADSRSEQSFYRNVLGTDVPTWPSAIARDSELRVQAWTFIVPSVVEAGRRLRENNIAIVYDAVEITTPYLGDHKTLAIRGPDGTLVQLVESTSH